jgi:hypothetical protein
MDLDIQAVNHFFTRLQPIPEPKQRGFTAVASIRTSVSLLAAVVLFPSVSQALTMLP